MQLMLVAIISVVCLTMVDNLIMLIDTSFTGGDGCMYTIYMGECKS